MTPSASSATAIDGATAAAAAAAAAASFSYFSSSKTPTVLLFCPKSRPKARLLSFSSRPTNAPPTSLGLSLARRRISPAPKASGGDFLAPGSEATHATSEETAGDHHPVASTADEDAEGQDAVAPDVNGSRRHNGFECLANLSSIGVSTNADAQDEEDLILKNKPWMVPWKIETIIQVMLLWIASFWFVGSWIIPIIAHAAGFSKESLTHRGQALYSLLTDIFEGLAGIAILYRCLAKFRPLPAGWFRFSLEGSWHFDVGLGCLLFPLVNFLSQVNINLVPALPAPPVGVSSVEQSIVARDPIAMVLYAVVVSVCAPVWEEIIFRGFLLPSLTRYMPLWSSVLVSAVAFALAHFNAQRLLPLVLLGVVMGAVFARSRNLLASILLHSLWNGFVFLDLMK